MSLYRIWWGDSTDRREVARVKAEDIDQVIEFVKTEFLKPNTEFYDTEESEDHAYLMIDVCKDCENYEATEEDKEELCDFCEHSEYIGIEQDDDVDPEFKTIYGTNDYYDLTDPQQLEQSKVYNQFLNEAWKTSPRLGVSALIIQTIKDNPHLEQGFSKELIAKSKKDLNL